jgi:8-oxo-dGTP diphosphatase
MKIRPAIVIKKDNHIMLMRYSYSGNDVYQFPGGNMEDVETLEETLSRELQEELNLPVSVGKLLITAQVINHTKKQSTLHCLFEGNILNSAKPTINAGQTSAIEVTWIEIAQLDQINLYPSVGSSLKESLQKGIDSTLYLGAINQPWF